MCTRNDIRWEAFVKGPGNAECANVAQYSTVQYSTWPRHFHTVYIYAGQNSWRQCGTLDTYSSSGKWYCDKSQPKSRHPRKRDTRPMHAWGKFWTPDLPLDFSLRPVHWATAANGDGYSIIELFYTDLSPLGSTHSYPPLQSRWRKCIRLDWIVSSDYIFSCRHLKHAPKFRKMLSVAVYKNAGIDRQAFTKNKNHRSTTKLLRTIANENRQAGCSWSQYPVSDCTHR